MGNHLLLTPRVVANHYIYQKLLILSAGDVLHPSLFDSTELLLLETPANLDKKKRYDELLKMQIKRQIEKHHLVAANSGGESAQLKLCEHGISLTK